MKARKGLLILFLFVIFVFARPVSLDAYIGLCCGKCGGNMPLNIPGGGIPETYEFRLKLIPRYMRMNSLRDGSHKVSTRRALNKGYMMVPHEMDMHMLNLPIGYSLTDRFFMGLMGMYMNKDMEMKNNLDLGSDMKSEGLADTMLMTKYRLLADDPLIPTNQLSLLWGLKIPTGSISEKDHGVRLPYSMQLGSGTFDPTFGLLYQGSSSPWWWGTNFLYTGRFYDNKRDYHLGDEFRYDFYAMYQFRYDLVAEFQIGGRYIGNISGESDDSKRGTGHIMGNPKLPFMSPLWDTDTYGGYNTDLKLGFQWQPWPLTILNLQFNVPLYQHYRGLRMEEDFGVMVSFYIELPTKASRRSKAKAPVELGF